MDEQRIPEVSVMTEAKQRQVEQSIRLLLDGGVRSVTEVLREVESQCHVGIPAVQRLFYQMMSDGEVRLGPGFIPVVAD